jgi:hypothetical protein
MAQVIRRTPQAPVRSKSQQFGEAFSNLAQGTSEHLYSKHVEEKEDKALSKLLGFDVSGLDKETRKELVKQTAKTKSRQQLFGDLPSQRKGTQDFGEDIRNPLNLSAEETGQISSNEYAGTTPKQKISNLEDQLNAIDEEDQSARKKEKKSANKPQPIPQPNLHSQEDIDYLVASGALGEANNFQNHNRNEIERYDRAIKDREQQRRHEEDINLKKRGLEQHEYENSPEYIAEKQRTLLGVARDNEVFKNVDEYRLNAPNEEAALGAIEDAVINGNQDFLSFNNLAEMTGMELWRDAAGGQFKTGVKTFLINSVGKFGARPNQYIETQMADALTKVGRTRSANMITINALRFSYDINKKYVEIADEVREGKFTPGDAGKLIQQKMKDYIDQRQNDLKKNYEFIKENQEKIDSTPEGRIPMRSSKGKLLYMPKDKIFEALVDGAAYI